MAIIKGTVMVIRLQLIVAILVALISVFASLSLGAVPIQLTALMDTFSTLLQSGIDSLSGSQSIVYHLRLPRTLIAFIAGGALALSGLILQVITRNPLADPYLFGISSGASFGAVVSLAFAQSLFWLPLSISAFVGSMLAMLLLIIVSRMNRYQRIETIVLSGVAVSFMFSALTSLFLYWSDPQAITSILFWSMGSFANVELSAVIGPVVLLVAALFVVMTFHAKLVALTLGDESAITLGVNVKRLRITMLIIASILTASIVAVAGGIGFVGLMIPHIVRKYVNFGEKYNPIMTVLVGGIFMLWVDILCRVALENQELPIGVVTSALGSVFFLSLLYWRSHRQSVH
jgi:iron complex transport system permease protein